MKQGFTLIESIVTLVLLFVLSGMAVQLFATPYRETAQSVRRTADQCRMVEVMEQLVADALSFQEHEPLDALQSRIAAHRYGDDVRILVTPVFFEAGTVTPVAPRTSAEQGATLGRSAPDLLLIAVEKNDMRLSRVYSN
ncbi:MAG: prepilin-type N-terminal cleavage/methylation domain-containing protein [Bilophila sp.]